MYFVTATQFAEAGAGQYAGLEAMSGAFPKTLQQKHAEDYASKARADEYLAQQANARPDYIGSMPQQIAHTRLQDKLANLRVRAAEARNNLQVIESTLIGPYIADGISASGVQAPPSKPPCITDDLDALADTLSGIEWSISRITEHL